MINHDAKFAANLILHSATTTITRNDTLNNLNRLLELNICGKNRGGHGSTPCKIHVKSNEENLEMLFSSRDHRNKSYINKHGHLYRPTAIIPTSVIAILLTGCILRMSTNKCACIAASSFHCILFL